jgi:hypothetical protein
MSWRDFKNSEGPARSALPTLKPVGKGEEKSKLAA